MVSMRTRVCCPDNTSLSPLRTSACPRENRITASWDPNLWVGKQVCYSDVHHIFSILNPNRPIGSYALRNEWVKPRRSNVNCLYICRNHNTLYNNHGHRMTQVPVTVLFITFYKYRCLTMPSLPRNRDSTAGFVQWRSPLPHPAGRWPCRTCRPWHFRHTLPHPPDG